MHILNRLFKIQLPAAMLTSLLYASSGCSSEEDYPSPTSSEPAPQIIVMYAPGGLGDQGYVDCILAGVQNFKRCHYAEVDMYQYSPVSMEDAELLVTDWLAIPQSSIPSLFVVASGDYETLIKDALKAHPLTDNKQMLMFENDINLDLPITIFSMSMYGASYPAGVTAAECLKRLEENPGGKDALILLAHPDDLTITKSEAGFRAGFSSAGLAANAYTEYLADDWTGYVSVNLLQYLLILKNIVIRNFFALVFLS